MKRRELIEIIKTMRESAQGVIDNWSEGDLAAAVNGLEESIAAADEAIDWWNSEEES